MTERVVDATVGYLVFGGVASLVILIPVLALVGLAGRRGGRAISLMKRTVAFASILFAAGLPANILFTLVMRERFYTDNDPLVDWLPWAPSGDWVVDVACQGHYLAGASAWTLRLGWALLALPVWGLTIWAFRRFVRSTVPG